MKNKIATFLVCLLIMCVGCSIMEDRNPDGEGYIFKVTTDSVLILNPIDPRDMGKEWNEISETYRGKAIVLRTKASNMEVGQYIRYWIEGDVMESFPEQATAKKIEMLKKNKIKAEEIKIISEQDALKIAKQHDQDLNLKWTLKYEENLALEINNQRQTFKAWVATAFYPAGNKMIVYLDARTGETIALSEIEAGSN